MTTSNSPAAIKPPCAPSKTEASRPRWPSDSGLRNHQSQAKRLGLRSSHGKEITIPKGAEFIAYVNGDCEIVRFRFQPAASVTAPAEQDLSGAPETPEVGASVLVSSTPPGADIELDESFVGSTPSVINMPAGEHTIVIKKKSFKRWERKIRAMRGSIKIEAELEPNK